jgi:hypothetical protein
MRNSFQEVLPCGNIPGGTAIHMSFNMNMKLGKDVKTQRLKLPSITEAT